MSTVNISFNSDLLKQIDKAAREECRSRSELLRAAARYYIDRKERWAQIFQSGRNQALNLGLDESDIEKEIVTYRKKTKQ